MNIAPSFADFTPDALKMRELTLFKNQGVFDYGTIGDVVKTNGAVETFPVAVKYYNSGIPVWAKYLKDNSLGIGQLHEFTGCAIAPDGGGGFFIGGKKDANGLSIGFLVHLDKNGKFVWGQDFGENIPSMVYDPISKDIIAISLESTGTGSNTIVAKFSYTGTLINSFKILDISPSKIMKTQSGFAIAGTYQGTDIWLAKLDANLNNIWANRYSIPGGFSFYTNLITGSNIDVTHNPANGHFGFTGRIIQPSDDIFIMDVDGNGVMNYFRTYPIAGSSDRIANSITWNEDNGGYVMSGQFLPLASGLNETFLYSVDVLGDWLWIKTINSQVFPPGVTGYSETLTSIETVDQNYFVVAGWFREIGTNVNKITLSGMDFSTGTFQTGSCYEDLEHLNNPHLFPTGTAYYPTQPFNTFVIGDYDANDFPLEYVTCGDEVHRKAQWPETPVEDWVWFSNPDNGYLDIHYGLSESSLPYFLEIYDLSGKLIEQIPLQTSGAKLSLSIDHIPSGVYLGKVTSGELVIHLDKLIIY